MRNSGSRWTGTLIAAAVTVAGCSAAASGGPDPVSVSARPPVSRAPGPVSQPGRSAGSSPRIMIVGDSITHGSAGDYTWQYWLYEHLRADGVSPQMVGPDHWLYNNVTRAEGDLSYANPRFERANDSTWGMTLSGEKTAIGATVAAYRPDYLLVLLGLDDLFWDGISQPAMAANLASFIASARSAQPHLRIVLGLIPPNIHTKTSPALAASVAGYNATIGSTAVRLSDAGSPIAVAQDTDLSVAADLWDGTHPNTNGQIRIAAAFADVLASKFRLGAAYPTPFPVLPAGPLARPRLTVTPSLLHGQVRLSWTLVPGANGYFVYLDKVSAGQTGFRRLPYPLTPARDPFVAGLLTPGKTYAFKVQACKGFDCGAFSQVVSIVAP